MGSETAAPFTRSAVFRLHLRRRPVGRARTGALLVALASCAVAAGALAGCGSGSGPPGRTDTVPLKHGESPFSGHRLYGKRSGGTLNAYSSVDVTSLDPARADSSLDEAIAAATQRPLFSYLPSSAWRLEPNLAETIPTLANHGIADGGRTVIVHIRTGVRFGPPVDRAVTSADVAYAIERGANPHVASPWFIPYFGDIVGAAHARGGSISGIRTPNPTTIVFRLSRPTATLLIDALSLPLSAPVPKSFAAPMDRHDPSTYGVLAEVATGPYMLRARRRTGRFAGLGYVSGRSLTLVRNPSWSRRTYSRAFSPPAYLDRIDVSIGGDPQAIGQQVLKGSDAVELDTPAPSVVQEAYGSFPSQITFTPGIGLSYGGLDTRVAPFDNAWVRRAVWAAVDRQAIVTASGGALLARPMTQFLTPGTPGFARAGGAAGPAYTWNGSLNGNPSLAHELMKRAGYPSGAYTGSTTLDEVADDGGDAPAVAGIVKSALQSLGFKVALSTVDPGVQAARYCGVPATEVTVCPSAGVTRAFDDPASLLLATFDARATDLGSAIAAGPSTGTGVGDGTGVAGASGTGPGETSGTGAATSSGGTGTATSAGGTGAATSAGGTGAATSTATAATGTSGGGVAVNTGAGTAATTGSVSASTGTAYGSVAGTDPATIPAFDPDPSEFDEPSIDAAMLRAEQATSSTELAREWARIDRRLVFEAAGLPETFDIGAAIRSHDVDGVPDVSIGGTWDLAFTSLQNP